MRIPSQLNDESLYGRRGQSRQSSQPNGQPYRRLVRLCVALALVVVVMKQASHPDVYETFFGNEENHLDDSTTNSDLATTAASKAAVPPSAVPAHDGTAPNDKTETQADDAAQRRIPLSEVSTESRSVANLITQSLSPNEQRQWTVVLDQWQSNETVHVIASMVSAMIDVVQQTEGIDDEQRLAWVATFRRFGERHAADDEIFAGAYSDTTTTLGSAPGADKTLGDEPPHQEGQPKRNDAAIDSHFLSAFLAQLDQAATDRVVDGAVWRSADFDAFYRQLDLAPQLATDGAIGVSVVPLMQQPKTYLGQRVRVGGQVVRAEKKVAAANPFGVDHYWELWVRPSNGGDRPFVLIVPDVPATVAKIDGETNVYKGPEIKVVGRFFKRLAYGSKFGADAAPVIIGRVLGLRNRQANAKERSTRKAGSITGTTARGDFLLIAAIASLLGLTFAASVMWRTKVSARRSRQLRQSNRPGPDLSLIKSSTAPDNPIDRPQ
ncbi:hypothetical protein [Planctomycetes bacterium K23_9]